MSFQLPICRHDVTGTHSGCLVNRLFVSIILRVYSFGMFCYGLFVSMVLCVLIVSDVSIVFLSPLCQVNSLGVSYQSFICLHEVTSTHWGRLVKRQFVPMVSWVIIQSVNCLFLSMTSRVQIGSVFF